MTATTKEQRAVASIYIEKNAAERVTFPASFIAALLADAEEAEALRERVAQQADENERMRMMLHEFVGAAMVADISEVAEEEIEGWALSWLKKHDAAKSERDTLRRLLTETAVPALEHCVHQPHRNRVDHSIAADTEARVALSSIRAQMEGGNG